MHKRLIFNGAIAFEMHSKRRMPSTICTGGPAVSETARPGEIP
ncbi:hypothetical protein BURPS406E_D0333 [Burkholderia pseudomallei 406e]|nr:hypothetical protein BMASAVP1_1275 [Burkholderia mallei SAVP1]ABO02467.1 hypothetical protein BMA10247_A0135 [Burkholderia mallei NCTC 10247]EBA50136.1 hypothetical protein BURPS305_6217 [Burkholderia pseudomallei 305]EDO88711.1 hypothetical protein BURPS406E_D0333 [Burkholderia pseudomallei 406e]EDO89257.1 hypothetical protein BURPSPAST_AC0258 [Burkholderia pseudomallei Pasteur 52237]EDP87626.1 hypothetical protein BMA10399_B1333 [Burkholderia mallei ATCC 10399]EDS83814.1 hypothetical pro